jgi:hypothetical protein
MRGPGRESGSAAVGDLVVLVRNGHPYLQIAVEFSGSSSAVGHDASGEVTGPGVLLDPAVADALAFRLDGCGHPRA